HGEDLRAEGQVGPERVDGGHEGCPCPADVPFAGRMADTMAPGAAVRTSSSDATRIAPFLGSRVRAILARDPYREAKAGVNENRSVLRQAQGTTGPSTGRSEGPRNRAQRNVPPSVLVGRADGHTRAAGASKQQGALCREIPFVGLVAPMPVNRSGGAEHGRA